MRVLVHIISFTDPSCRVRISKKILNTVHPQSPSKNSTYNFVRRENIPRCVFFHAAKYTEAKRAI